jgi:hypothetical protein
MLAKALDRAAEAVIGTRLDLPAEHLAEILDPEAIVAARKGPGGASQSSMEVMLAEIRDTLAKHKEWYRDRLDNLAKSRSDLQSAATALAVASDSKNESEGSSQTPGDEQEKTMEDLLSELPKPNWRRQRWR